MPRGSRAPAFRTRAALIFAAAVVAAHLLARSQENPWDDAYFFKRIALNFVHHGTLAWNVSEGPVYGSTSLAFQLLAVLLVLLSPAHYFSWLALIAGAFELLLLRLYLALLEPSKPAAERPADDLVASTSGEWAILLALLAWASPLSLRLLQSGMDFHLGFLVLAKAVLSVRRYQPTWRAALSFSAWTVLSYLVRPDAAMLPVLTLAAYEWLRAHRLPWRALGLTLVGVLAVCGVCWFYFGTPVPLSFYLKSHVFSNYGAEFIESSLPYKYRNAATFCWFVAPFVYVALHRLKPWPLATISSGLVFAAFHFVSTVEVMGYQARYYLPALVPIAFAAICSVEEFLRSSRPRRNLVFAIAYAVSTAILVGFDLVWTNRSRLDSLGRVAPSLYLGQVIAVGLWLVLAPAAPRRARLAIFSVIGLCTLLALPLPSFSFPSDAVLLERHIDSFTTTRGIRAVRACLREPLRLFHSEIGVPGLLFPNSEIIDFAGLMQEDVARHGFDIEARCEAKPEVIFLPHRVYAGLRRRIETSQCLQGYTRMVRSSSSPLFVRKDLASRFSECASRIHDPWVQTNAP